MVCCDYVISFASHIGSCVVCVYLSLYLSVSDVHTDVYKSWPTSKFLEVGSLLLLLKWFLSDIISGYIASWL